MERLWIARSSALKARAVGAVGDDEKADFVLHTLSTFGVDVAAMRRLPGVPTSVILRKAFGEMATTGLLHRPARLGRVTLTETDYARRWMPSSSTSAACRCWPSSMERRPRRCSRPRRRPAAPPPSSSVGHAGLDQKVAPVAALRRLFRAEHRGRLGDERVFQATGRCSLLPRPWGWDRPVDHGRRRLPGGDRGQHVPPARPSTST